LEKRLVGHFFYTETLKATGIIVVNIDRISNLVVDGDLGRYVDVVLHCVKFWEAISGKKDPKDNYQ